MYIAGRVFGPAMALLCLTGCVVSRRPVSSPPFWDVTKESGLNYRWTIPGKRPLNILQTIGNGCAFLDYDGDGNLDILLIGANHVALFKAMVREISRMLV